MYNTSAFFFSAVPRLLHTGSLSHTCSQSQAEASLEFPQPSKTMSHSPVKLYQFDSFVLSFCLNVHQCYLTHTVYHLLQSFIRFWCSFYNSASFELETPVCALLH